MGSASDVGFHGWPQFERTLIVAEEDSYVSYLEGCTAPSYDKNQVTLVLTCRILKHIIETHG